LDVVVELLGGLGEASTEWDEKVVSILGLGVGFKGVECFDLLSKILVL
jgi:hypothetical protein